MIKEQIEKDNNFLENLMASAERLKKEEKKREENKAMPYVEISFKEFFDRDDPMNKEKYQTGMKMCISDFNGNKKKHAVVLFKPIKTVSIKEIAMMLKQCAEYIEESQR